MSMLLGPLLQAAQAATPSPEPAATPTPPTIDQLVKLKRVGSVATSPDGTLVSWFSERVLDAK